MDSAARGRPVVVGVFGRDKQARQVVDSILRAGIERRQVSVFSAGRDSPSDTDLGQQLAAAATAGADISSVLVGLGVPEGEARFYAEEMAAGRSLVVVDAGAHAEAVRELVLGHGGYDVQSRGRALARGERGAGVAGGSGPRPIDLTGNWADVASRYRMLWQQHYGTTDATWEQMEPVYQFAWQAANQPRNRGRPWAEVSDAVRRDWEAATGHASGDAVAAAGGASMAGRSWSEVAGPIRDVWEDVADEATTGAEGGADRRIARQATDQTVAARDVAREPREMPPEGRFP